MLGSEKLLLRPRSAKIRDLEKESGGCKKAEANRGIIFMKKMVRRKSSSAAKLAADRPCLSLESSQLPSL